MARIAVGGFHIECSTYNPVMTAGPDFRALRSESLSASPYFAFLKNFPASFIPLVHVRAIAGGPVVRSYYETIKSELLQGLDGAGAIDGVYLAMHGALFVDGMEDAEGDLITAIRRKIGPDRMISVSYDLHGNVSQAVIDAIDMFSTYRTAPHIDVEETMRRSVSMLVEAIERRQTPFVVWCPIPVLLPGEQTSTLDEPAKSLYASLPSVEQETGAWDASLMVGYVWADEPRATAAAVLTGVEVSRLSAGAEQLASQYWDARHAFAFGSWTGSIEACIDRATQSPRRPFVIADSGDNPTGGGVGDRPDVLRALLERGRRNVIVAGIADAPATNMAYEAGVHGVIQAKIGATLDPRGGPPVSISGVVVHLAKAAQLSERLAVIAVQGVMLVLTATRRPFHNLGDFHAIGLEPELADIIVVKSGYLSPDMQALAKQDAMALSPGVVDQGIERLPRRRASRLIFPFDRALDWRPNARLSKRAPGRSEI